jgi:hypothetical protein
VKARGVAVCSVLAVAAITPLVSAGPVTAAATGLCARPTDTVAPQIASVTFDRHAVDLTSGPRTLGVTARAVDTTGAGPASGISSIEMRLHNAAGGLSNAALSLQSGTTTDGVWHGTFQLVTKARAGSWKLRQIAVTDQAGNVQIYGRGRKAAESPTDIRLHPAWDQSVTVTGATPPPPPAPPTRKPGTPTALRITPTTVNTTQHSERVTVTAAFRGPRPRRVAVLVHTLNPGALQFRRTARLQRTTGDHWKGSVRIDRWIGSGRARTPLFVTYGPNVSPGAITYNRSALQRLHLHPVLRTTSRADRTYPVLHALAFSPSTVDTTSGPQQVTVTASVTDKGSGVATVAAHFRAREGGEDDLGTEVDVTLHRHGSQWTGHATFPECIPNGTWGIGVDTFDNAGNGFRYRTNVIAQAGMSARLSVTSNPVDRTPPAVPTHTVSAASHTITLGFLEGVKNVTPSTLKVYALEPAASAFKSSLTIAGIVCSNATTVVDCAGSGITTAQLDVPGLAKGQAYQVWANVNSVTSQLTDGAGNPLDWGRSAALVVAS